MAGRIKNFDGIQPGAGETLTLYNADGVARMRIPPSAALELTGRLYDQGGAFFNARGYGAVGNGAANDTAALQQVLNAARDAGGGVVYVPDGTYLITSSLLIYNDTMLELSARAVIKRGALIDNMIRNGADGLTGGYAANRNIVVAGGTWDGNGAAYPSNCCVIAFGHATNVIVRDTTITGVYGWHHIEFNACQGARALGCRLLNFDTASGNREAVQLDLMRDAAVFPWFGPYDNTPCDDVLVQGCEFRALARGVGSHSSAAGVRHTNVRILGNHFTDCKSEAVHALNYQAFVVAGNHFENCFKGVFYYVESSVPCRDIEVSGNTFRDLRRTSPNDRAIQVVGSSTERLIEGVVIANNVIDECSRHAIGTDYVDGVSITGNTVKNVGTAASAVGVAIWVWNSTRATVAGNLVDGFVQHGIAVTAGREASVTGNTVLNGGKYGILIDANVSAFTVTGNTVANILATGAADTGYGVAVLSGARFGVVSGNAVRRTSLHGILLDGVTDCTVSDNAVTEASQAADLTYDCIHIKTSGGGVGSARNNVQANQCRIGTLVNRPRYGIRINGAADADNLVTNNDLLGGGATASFSDAGTGTVTVAGNRI